MVEKVIFLCLKKTKSFKNQGVQTWHDYCLCNLNKLPLLISTLSAQHSYPLSNA